MARLLFLLVFLCSLAWSDDVSVRVFNQRTPTSGTSATIRNIGQSQHLLWVQFTDSGGSCGAGSAAVWLEASYDGSQYFPLTPRLIQLDGTKIGQAMATGIYPALRVYSLLNAVNCALTVWYSGSTNPAAFPQMPRLLQSGYLFNSASATSTTGTPLFSNTQAGARVVLYGFWTANTGATQSGDLYFAPDGTCAVVSATVASVNMPTGAAPSIWPTSFVPYSYGPAGASLCWRLGGAGVATVYAVYRVE